MIPYVLTDLIGRGTHGRVFRGFHVTSKEKVAVKITPITISSDKEIEMIQKVQNCRNVVKYIEHYEYDDNYAIVMEEVVGIDGTYMKELSKHGIYLTENEIRTIAKKLCEMVYDCHERSILYGDIKPGNYMYIPPSNVKIIDFGCTRKGAHFQIPLGTPYYFSPQKFQKSYGLKSDVWSIGVLIYELTCGHHPFAHQSDSRDMLYQEILSTKLTFHHPHWDAMTAAMQDLITQMLDKREESRISAADVMCHPWWTMPL